MLTLLVCFACLALPLHARIVPGHKVCLTKTCVIEAATLLKTIDDSVSPCDDFYEFACGKWRREKQLPDNKARVNRFGDLQDELNDKLKGLILNTDLETEKREFVKNAKRYYDSCYNTKLLEELGDKPLTSLLERMGGWPVVLNGQWLPIHWDDLYLKLRDEGFGASILFSLSILPDFKNNSRRVLAIDQPSFGLGGRDSVLKGPNDTNVKAYKNLMYKSMLKLGASPPEKVVKEVDNIYAFELLLANNSMPKELRRNLTAIYDKMTIKELAQLAPNINWLKIVKGYVSPDITEDEEIISFDTNFIKFVNSILPSYSNEFLANIMLWRVIESEMTTLNDAWYKLKEEFSFVVQGTKSRSPRWEICLKNTKTAMNMALSHLYVKNFFKEEDREKALEMFTNVVKEFRRSLIENEWMASDTKEQALKKLDNMRLLVGYPEELMDENKIAEYYGNLKLSPTDYFGNDAKLSKWYTDYAFGRLREPVNQYDWRDLSSVAVVNAFYHQLKNLVVMPAGILQGVFFNKDRPNYLNYGSIGYVSGHEIIHGFDDGGRQYDSSGNLRNWWDSRTDLLYTNKSKCFVDKYSDYSVKEIGHKLNGINTQGENIADNGGIVQAFKAYLRHVEEYGPEPQLPALPYSSEQLFWISSAVQYCSKETNEYLKLQIMTDSHSPSRPRVNGVVVNSAEFAKVFECPLGTPMNPTHKCSIW